MARRRSLAFVARFRAASAVLFVFATAVLAEAGDVPEIRLHLRGPARRVVWTTGEVATVRWTGPPETSSPDTVHREILRVETSSDRGRSWSLIGRALLDAGEFSWTPDKPGAGQWVRLRSADGRYRSNRIRVRIDSKLADLAWASSFAVALHDDGSVWSWGHLPQAQTPDGEPYGLEVNGKIFLRSPEPVTGFEDARTVAGGGAHVLAIRRDGRLLSWGFAGSAFHASPALVPGIEHAQFARAEYDMSFVRLEDGRVFAWGENIAGSLGDGTTVPRPDPVEIPALHGATDIRLGNLCGLALMPDGSVLSWGFNGYGQAGDGTFEDASTPRPVSLPSTAAGIAAAEDAGMAVLSDGSVMTWGGNQFGQLGAGRLPDRDPHPTRVAGLSGITEAACGGGLNFYALRRDGALFAWGLNDSGELGDGTRESRARPVRVQVPPIQRLFVGPYPVHALTTDGHRFAWGGNAWLLGDGGYRSRATPKRFTMPWPPTRTQR